MAGIGDAGIIQKIAVPAVCMLVAFLGYFSQYIFRDEFLDPGPLTKTESIVFNGLLLCLWYTYARTVTVDPGRYEFPGKVIEAKGRWCNKCAAPKPARAHHCKHCKRCIPKMDHHCPWTSNCVSMTTFPHFMRFLVYTNASLAVLGYLLYQRVAKLWEDRYLPSYLGPSVGTLISLSLVALVYVLTSLVLFIMLVTTAKSWVVNQTMIEMWEADRHETISQRGGKDWWDITGPDGETIRFEKIEFPYDIGFFANMAQAMGTSIFLFWLWPFAGHPRLLPQGKGTVGWVWEENGFNRKEGMWPPPDPEKIRRATRQWAGGKRDFAKELRDVDMSPEERKTAFKDRQDKDLKRQRKALLAELEEEQGDTGVVVEDYEELDPDSDYDDEEEDEWADGDGEKLADFGVDEDETNYDYTVTDVNEDEDVPLGELLRRRKAQKAGSDE